ncbi:ubiquitin-like domain-containing protein [Streptomyces sp. NPDC050585]|uniref:ubiquitin-like domain-containing protein n=1 Tax=Streptomyces sp. NPDC050585 TaxID=3365632 RepID=UPI00379319CF
MSARETPAAPGRPTGRRGTRAKAKREAADEAKPRAADKATAKAPAKPKAPGKPKATSPGASKPPAKPKATSPGAPEAQPKAPGKRQPRDAGVPAAPESSAAAPAPAPAVARRLLPQVLVVAGLVALLVSGGVLVTDHKAVRLSVDGERRTLHTFADDVGELLAAQDIATGPHDRVTPAPGTPLTGGQEVAVRWGRPLRLDVDGEARRVWTTARTVDEALRALGVRARGARLSVSRSAPIGRDGLALAVRTERAVTFRADGRERTVRTHAATVAEALRQARITLQGLDRISVPPGAFPRDGQTVTVQRVRDRRETRWETVPYAVRRVRDPRLYRGAYVVDRQGRPGLRRLTYEIRTVDGVPERTRRTGTALVREPVARVVRVGTRERPAKPRHSATAAPQPGSGNQSARQQAAAPEAVPARQSPSVAGTGHLNWAALAACESGGRPDAVDPTGTYGGLYQFDVRTWRSVGGSGRPQDASAAEQTYRAKKLYAQRGASPWPVCGRRLYR